MAFLYTKSATQESNLWSSATAVRLVDAKSRHSRSNAVHSRGGRRQSPADDAIKTRGGAGIPATGIATSPGDRTKCPG